MTKDELDTLRKRVENEPGDERGALARILMGEIDRMTGEREARSRTALIETLKSSWNLTTEDATRYVDTVPMPVFGLKHGKCRACRGRGTKVESGCMGGRVVNCDVCSGHGTTMILKLPWEEEKVDGLGV